MKYEDCISKGLLRREFPSTGNAKKSLEKAEKFLLKAKRNMAEEDYDSTVILAYLSVFNAARSVLLRDGYRERSHACVSMYIEKHYVPSKLDGRLVRLFDRFRNIRHDDQYDVSFSAGKGDAESMIKFAEEFIPAMKKLVGT